MSLWALPRRQFQGLQLEREACLASNYALAKENLALRPRLEMGRTALAIKYQDPTPWDPALTTPTPGWAVAAAAPGRLPAQPCLGKPPCWCLPRPHPGTLLSAPSPRSGLWLLLGDQEQGGRWEHFPPQATSQRGDSFTQQMCPQA